MLANNLCLWLVFTLAFWASFSANPFQGVLDTSEMHAGRLEIVEEEGLQTRLWAQGAADKAQLSLTVAGEAGDLGPGLLAEVSSTEAASSLRMSGGGVGETSLIMSAHAAGAALCVGVAADCQGPGDPAGLWNSLPAQPRTLVLDGDLVAVDGALLVNQSLTISPGIVMVGQAAGTGDYPVATLNVGSESQPALLSVNGGLRTDATMTARGLRVTESVQLGAGGAVFVGGRQDQEDFVKQNASNTSRVWVHGELHVLNDVEIGGSESDTTLTVRASTDFQNDAIFSGDVSMGQSNESVFAIHARTELHAPMHVRADAVIGSNSDHTLTVSGDAAVRGNAFIHGTLAVLSDFSTSDIAVTGTIRVGDPMSGTGVLGIDVVGGGSFGGDFAASGAVTLGDPQRAGSSVHMRAPVVLESDLSSTEGTVSIATSELGDATVGQMRVQALNLTESLIISSTADVVWDTADEVTFRNLNITSDITTNGTFLGFGDFEMRGETLLVGTVTAVGDMTIGSGEEDVMRVMSSTDFLGTASLATVAVSGDTTMTGSLSATAGVVLGGAVTIGSGESDVLSVEAPTTFRGEVAIASSRRALEDDEAEVTRPVFTVDGLSELSTLDVEGAVTGGELSVQGDTVLGSDSGSALQVNAVATMTSDLNALGHTTLESLHSRASVLIDSTATIVGSAAFHDGVSVHGPLVVDGSLTLASTGAVPESCVVDPCEGYIPGTPGNPSTSCPPGCTLTGTAGTDESCMATVTDCSSTYIPGDVENPSTTCPTGCVFTPATEDSTVNINGDCAMASGLAVEGDVVVGDDATDSLTVRAASSFRSSVSVDGDVTVGSGPTSTMAVNSQMTVTQASTFEDSMQVDGVLTVASGSTFQSGVAVQGLLGASGGLQVGGDATFKDDANGDLVLIDGHARTIEMNGDLTVTGLILADGGFAFGDAIEVDLINSASSGVGVTIEGVQFIDGGLEFSRADIIEELYEGRGVSVEGVIHRDGVMMIESTFPGVDPTGSLDAVTLKNIGCSQNMIDTETAIKFRQMYYHSDGISHASVQSGNIAIGTETNWSEDPQSQDSYFLVQTTEAGQPRDRLRISTERVQIWHDLRVGDQQVNTAETRSVGVHANQGDAVLDLTTNQGIARVMLQDASNAYVIEKDDNVLRLDASADPQGELHITPGANGLVNVAEGKFVIAGADGSTDIAGNVEIGDSGASGVARSLRIFEPSGAELSISVGGASELMSKITMGGGAHSFELLQLGSSLRLDAKGSDGNIETRPGSSGRFAVANTAGDDLVAVDGTSGDTGIVGNLNVGGSDVSGARAVGVATSSGAATVELSSGGDGATAGLYLGDPDYQFLVGQVADVLTVSADDGVAGNLALRAAEKILVSSGSTVMFDNDVHVLREDGNNTLLLARTNDSYVSAVEFGYTGDYNGTVFNLVAQGTSLKLGRANSPDGVSISDTTVDLRSKPGGEVRFHSSTVVTSDDGDAVLSIAPKRASTYLPAAATLRLNQHANGDGTRTLANCQCKDNYQEDPEQGGQTYHYECAPGSPGQPEDDSFWCAVNDDCGTPNIRELTFQYSSNIFTAPPSGPTQSNFDGSVGFEFEATANFAIFSLGRSLPPGEVALSADSEVQLWSTGSLPEVLASVTVGPESPIEDGFVIEQLDSALSINVGEVLRISFTVARADEWYQSGVDGLVNSTFFTLTTAVYGAGGGYPIDNFQGQLAIAVPTFVAGEIWTVTDLTYWYDYCVPWSGADFGMESDSTALSMTLHGNADLININPGAAGSLRVHDTLLEVDVASNQVRSSGQVVVSDNVLPATCTGTADAPICAYSSGTDGCPAGCDDDGVTCSGTASTPTCDLDGSTDGTASCPAGCALTDAVDTSSNFKVQALRNAVQLSSDRTDRSSKLEFDLAGTCTGTADEVPATCAGTADTPICAYSSGTDGCPTGCDDDGVTCSGTASTPTCDLDGSTDGTASCPAGCALTDAYTPICDLDPSTDSSAPADEVPATCTGTADTPICAYSSGTDGCPAGCDDDGVTCSGTASTPTCDLDGSTDGTASCPAGCALTDAYTPNCPSGCTFAYGDTFSFKHTEGVLALNTASTTARLELSPGGGTLITGSTTLQGLVTVSGNLIADGHVVLGTGLNSVDTVRINSDADFTAAVHIAANPFLDCSAGYIPGTADAPSVTCPSGCTFTPGTAEVVAVAATDETCSDVVDSCDGYVPGTTNNPSLTCPPGCTLAGTAGVDESCTNTVMDCVGAGYVPGTAANPSDSCPSGCALTMAVAEVLPVAAVAETCVDPDESVLSVAGHASFTGGLMSSGDVLITASTLVDSNLQVNDDIVLGSDSTDTLTVNAAASMNAALTVAGSTSLGDLTVREPAVLQADATFQNNVLVLQLAEFDGHVRLGDTPADIVTVEGTFAMESDFRAHADASLGDPRTCTGTADEVPATCAGTADTPICAYSSGTDGCPTGCDDDGVTCSGTASTPTCDLDGSTDGTASCPAGCALTDAYTPICDLDPSTDSSAPADEVPATCTGTADTPICAYSSGTDGCPAGCDDDGVTCSGTASTPTCDLDGSTDGTASCPAGCALTDAYTPNCPSGCRFESDVLTVDATTVVRSPLRVSSDVTLGETVSDSVVIEGSLDVRNDFIKTLSVRGDLIIKNAAGARQLTLDTSRSKMIWTLCSDACGVRNGDGSSCADVCGVPNGDGSSCHDVCGVSNGDSTTCLDACGVAAGDGSSCADVCGVANGDGTSCLDACGVPAGNGESCLDVCGVPNGDGTSCLDSCGVPNGIDDTCITSCANDPSTGASVCTDACGASQTVEACIATARTACANANLSGDEASSSQACSDAGACEYVAADANSGTIEACVATAEATCAGADISGDDAASETSCEAQGACDYVAAVAGDGSSCADVCGVPNGDGSSCHDVCGVSNGDSTTCLDACGVAAGDGSSCADVCGVANGDGTSCLDACGVPAGNGESCLDVCGVPNGDGTSCLDSCGVPDGDGSMCAFSCNENMYIDLGSGDLHGGGIGSFQDDLSTQKNLYVGDQGTTESHASLDISSAVDVALTLYSLAGGDSKVTLSDPVSAFVIEKDDSVLRLDASADSQGELHITPGANGLVNVAGGKFVIAGADGSTDIAGNVEIGDSGASGVARSLRIFEPSGAELSISVGGTSALTLTSASATDSSKITMGGGAHSFELLQLASSLRLDAKGSDGNIETRPGSSGRFAVANTAGDDLVAVDGTSGDTGIVGNLNVGGSDVSGARAVGVATSSGAATVELSSGGDGATAGLYLTSSSGSGASAQYRMAKTSCPNLDGLPRPSCSSLRIDAGDANGDGEIRMVASEIHTDDGHLLANHITVRSSTATGFQGQTIDLNSGIVTSGASVLEPSPGMTAPNDPIPTETISINNFRVTPTSVVVASVVDQCNDRSGVTITKITAGTGNLVFAVANFGTRACGGGSLSADERYTISWYLVSDTSQVF